MVNGRFDEVGLWSQVSCTCQPSACYRRVVDRLDGVELLSQEFPVHVSLRLFIGGLLAD